MRARTLSLTLNLALIAVTNGISIPKGLLHESLARLSDVVTQQNRGAVASNSRAAPCTNTTMDIRALDLNYDGVIDDDEFIAWGLAQGGGGAGAVLVPLDSDADAEQQEKELQEQSRGIVARRSLQRSQNPFKTEAELHACEDALYHMQSNEGSHITIQVFMMSKCPFAARALKAIVPAMIQMQLFEYVTLRLDFIGHGSLDSMSGLQSLHGSDEVLGNKLYLCMQDMNLPIQQWMLLVICIASDPQNVPYNAKGCFDMARVTSKQQAEITECAQEPRGRGDQLLEKSFHLTTQQHRIANSPTIYFTVEQDVHNQTDIEDSIEVLYCGDRGPADFISALCSLLGTLLRAEDLRVDMINNAGGGVDECPVSMETEPECTDNTVKMGSAWFMVPALFLGCSVAMFVCHGICLRTHADRHRHRVRVGMLDGRDGGGGARGRQQSPGLTAAEIEQLPSVVIGAPASEDDKPICSICFDVLEEGELAYQLSCRHHHHQDCLRDWLTRKAECPECRTAVARPGAAAAAVDATVVGSAFEVERSGQSAVPRTSPSPATTPTPLSTAAALDKECSNCGGQIPADSVFCTSCGAPAVPPTVPSNHSTGGSGDWTEQQRHALHSAQRSGLRAPVAQAQAAASTGSEDGLRAGLVAAVSIQPDTATVNPLVTANPVSGRGSPDISGGLVTDFI